MKWHYSYIDHGRRKELQLDMEEFALLDLLYRTQTSPTNKTPGWCNLSYRQIQEILDIPRSTLHDMMNRLSRRELLERESSLKRATRRFYEGTYAKNKSAGPQDSDPPADGLSEKLIALVDKLHAEIARLRSENERLYLHAGTARPEPESRNSGRSVYPQFPPDTGQFHPDTGHDFPKSGQNLPETGQLNKEKINTYNKENIRERDSAFTPGFEDNSFRIPTVGELTAYFLSRRVDEDIAALEAEKFLDYYESVGWKVGRYQLRNWRSAAARWMARMDEYGDFIVE